MELWDRGAYLGSTSSTDMRSILTFLLATYSTSFAFAQADAAGCTDHPMITRYPGAMLAYCDVQNFMDYAIATGPIAGYKKIGKWTEVKGQRTRLYYTIKGTVSLRDLYLNYLSGLERGEFTLLAKNIEDKSSGSTIGSRQYLGIAYERNNFPASSGIALLHGSATSAGSFYMAGSLTTPEGKAHVVIGGAQLSTEEKVLLVDIIEENTIATDKISVTAQWMKQEIDRNGKVALDILFDHDKATVQTASLPIIVEIAQLLKEQGDWKLYVVGHTDMTGTLDHNRTLSQARAAEVVRLLTTQHGIAPERLDPHGVGPLAPASTNATDGGRQMNRRVELVKR